MVKSEVRRTCALIGVRLKLVKSTEKINRNKKKRKLKKVL